MIDNVVAALGLGLNLTDEEIADVLWLAVQMQQFGDGVISEQGDRNEALENSVPNREIPKQPAQPLRDADRDRQVENKKDEQNFEVHSKNDQGDDRSTRRSDELQLKIPDARSLQEPLELARSLRPLMRRVPSQVNTLLDEEATVRRIAEEKIWCPVLRPALEPWLDLALVIDDSASMLMWRHTIAELQHFLSSYGVFRDVRVWRLGTDKAEKVCIYAGATASDRNGSPRSPSELIEANGRGLVLMVSDCIAPIWRNGAIASALQVWSRSGMVAILQMLPDWLWGRTALGRGVAAQFSALAAGIPNYQLTTTTVSTWYDIDLATSIKIPVVTLEPEKFTAWAEMLAGKGGAWSAGIVFEPELFAGQEVAIEFDGASELDAEDRVQSFRLTASPIARRLAGLLAAAPVISLPIVRILQSKVLTQSQPVHVAEVFLGGLLKPLSEITAKTNPNYVQYDFIEGVRDLLLESVPSSEIVNIVAEVSEYIAERLGVSLEEFGAVIRNPRQVENTELVSQTRPFALLTAQILKRLGGEYVKFANSIIDNISVEVEDILKTETQEINGVSYFNQAKVILLGEGGVGKTSLLMRLLDGEFKPNEYITEGINIRDWRVQARKQSVRLRIWDFGGQEIYHATHQLFLTERSLYLLVINTRRDELANRIEYWLKLIENMGNKAPVIIVCNKIDEHPLDINKRSLQDKYSNIKGFIGTSSATGLGINELKQQIVDIIANEMPHVFDLIPVQWLNLMEKLEQDDCDYITYQEYENKCNEMGITKESSKTLAQLLHELGIILNFNEDPKLQNTVVLNPRWVVGAIYRILSDDLLLTKHKGILQLEDLTRILTPKNVRDKNLYSYGRDRQFILDLMQKFELCFPIEINSPQPSYLITGLLPSEEPDTGIWRNPLDFEYHYRILFSSIISRFIVKMFHLICNRTYWLTGVVLESKDGNRAYVKANLDDAKIFIRIDGNLTTRRAFLSSIRNTFDEIHHTFSTLEVDERIPLPDNLDITVSYDLLVNLEKRGITNYSLEGSNRNYNIHKLLNGIIDFTSQELKKLIDRKWRLKAELLSLTKDNKMVRTLLNEIDQIDNQISLDSSITAKERKRLIDRKLRLKAELLSLTKDVQKVNNIFREIDKIDEKLSLLTSNNQA